MAGKNTNQLPFKQLKWLMAMALLLALGFYINKPFPAEPIKEEALPTTDSQPEFVPTEKPEEVGTVTDSQFQPFTNPGLPGTPVDQEVYNQLKPLVAEAWGADPNLPKMVSGRTLLLNNLQVIGDWALGDAVLTTPLKEHGGPDDIGFMGRKKAGSWQVALDFTPIYLDWFKQAGAQFFRDPEFYRIMRDKSYQIP